MNNNWRRDLSPIFSSNIPHLDSRLKVDQSTSDWSGSGLKQSLFLIIQIQSSNTNRKHNLAQSDSVIAVLTWWPNLLYSGDCDADVL